MTISGLRNDFNERLAPLYLKEERAAFFNLLASHFLNMNKADVALNGQKELEDRLLTMFLKALDELLQEKPIQYITGSTEFYGLPFIVTEDVLIPRPETEELVDWILSDYSGFRVPGSGSQVQSSKKLHSVTNNQQPITVLDIGTGSGCIAISLAKNLPDATVYALDISAKTLDIAKKNAKQNQTEVHFLQADILKTPVILNGVKNLKFDIIVSNPPYVLELEKQEMKNNVLKYEPSQALFVTDDDPLVFYNAIAQFAKRSLQSGGRLYLEINQYLGAATVALLEAAGFLEVELRKDLYGNDRMIKAKLT